MRTRLSQPSASTALPAFSACLIGAFSLLLSLSAVVNADSQAAENVAAEVRSETPAAVVSASGSSTGYSAPEFSRYQGILNRKPFGTPPPPPPVAPVANQEEQQQKQAEQQLAKQVRLCAVTRTRRGIAAGFIDNAAKPAPRNYYLYVGEGSDGFVVESADVEKETAQISKDGVSLTFTLTGAQTSAERTPAGAVPSPRPLPPSTITPRRMADSPRSPLSSLATSEVVTASGIRLPVALATNPVALRALDPGITRAELFGSPEQPIPGTVRRIDALLTSGNVADVSYVERLKRRREEMVRAQEAERLRRELEAAEKAREITKEEVDRRMREYNLNLIRQGIKPPKPIVLTPEEDAQLVKEGVLQPQ